MISIKRISPYILAGIVFMGTFAQGLRMAVPKNLWEDEKYSQSFSVMGLSFKEIWLGRVPEGNNSPLFYTVQKMWLKLIHFEEIDGVWWLGVILDPQKGESRSWGQQLASRGLAVLAGVRWHGESSNISLTDIIKRQIVIFRVAYRIPSCFAFALTLSVLVWFFARFYSFFWGIFALCLALGSEVLWPFWADARPYGMIVLFSMMQALVLLHIVKGGSRKYLWWLLGIVHLLLALTGVVSIVQISCAALVCFYLGYRSWPLLGGIFLMSFLAMVFYYFTGTKKYAFFFESPVSALRTFFINMPWPRALLIIGATILLRFHPEGRRSRMLCFAGWVGCIAVATIGMIGLYYLKQTQNVGFGITGRYFINLAPISIVAVTALFAEVMGCLSSWKLKMYVLIIIAAFVLPDMVRSLGWLLEGNWPDYLRY